MTNRVKMILGGICNLIVLVTFALLLVVLSENQVVHRVLAQTTTELNSDRVVLTTQDAGSFVGKKEPVQQDDPNEVQRTYFAFRGIAYSSPPINELRWAPPQPVELKTAPHQAGEFKPPCSQWSVKRKKLIGNPDCLYLNIFTSYIPSANKRKISGTNVTSWTVENPNLLPVMVYIHGGEFLSGSATKYSPDALMKRERVVLVTFNYRLGVLGWLSTGDPNSNLPGNYGLLDQIAALKWIQMYIHRFGGNPLRVTIFGSVEYLLLANLHEEAHQQLFHAAIIKPQSSSVLSPFAKMDSKEGSKMFLKQLAENVGCRGEDGDNLDEDELIDCLKKADTDSLIRSQTKLLTFHNYPFVQKRASPLGPVVDGYLLEDEPEMLFSSGKFREVPIMIGLSADEGFNPFLEFYLKLARKGKKGGNKEAVGESSGSSSTEMGESRKSSDVSSVLAEGEVKDMLKNIMETVMAGIPDLEQDGAFDRVYESIWKYYFGGISAKSWGRDVEQVVHKLFRLFSDMMVNTGHCKLLNVLSKNSKAPVFSYVFSHGHSYFQNYFKETREIFENSEGMAGPKRPRRSLHMTLDTPWSEQYYLFYPVRDLDEIANGRIPATDGTYSAGNVGEASLAEDDRMIMDALAKIWVSFAKYAQPKQAITELPEYGRWVKMEPGHRSLNYYLISNSSLQRGMRSDFRKAECQFWMSTIPQVRKLSKVIQELEPFPILFWSSIAVVVLFALIILTLIVLIVCAKRKSGSYGGANGIYLQNTRDL